MSEEVRMSDIIREAFKDGKKRMIKNIKEVKEDILKLNTSVVTKLEAIKVEVRIGEMPVEEHVKHIEDVQDLIFNMNEILEQLQAEAI